MNPLVAFVLALLMHFEHRGMPARACITARQTGIAMHLEAAQRMGVPPALMLSVAWQESWAGCHPREGGGWGAPRDFQHRHIAGTPEQAAQILVESFAVCRSWGGAVTRFRSGYCTVPHTWPRIRGYVARVERLTRDLMQAVPAEPILWRLMYERGSDDVVRVTSGPVPRGALIIGGEYISSPSELVLAARRASPRPGGE